MPPGATANWVLGNHDKPRVASRYGPDRHDVLLTIQMTLPGVAVTYNVCNNCNTILTLCNFLPIIVFHS